MVAMSGRELKAVLGKSGLNLREVLGPTCTKSSSLAVSALPYLEPGVVDIITWPNTRANIGITVSYVIKAL